MSHTHQVQVAFYAIVIKRILEEQSKIFPGLRDLTVHPFGAIWLRGEPDPIRFSLEMPVEFVLSFLKRKLKHTVLEPNLQDVKWGLVPSCSGCEFVEGCHARAEKEESVCVVPGTKRRFKYFADKYKATHGKLKYPEETPNPLLDAAKSTPGAVPGYVLADYFDYSARRRAQEVGQVIAMGRASVTVPVSENAAVIFTAQVDPARGDLIGFAVSTILTDNRKTPVEMDAACSRTDFESVSFEQRRGVNAPHVPIHKSPLARSFIAALYNHLHTCQQNHQTVQVYTFDSAERRMLGDLLVSTVIDTETDEGTLKQAYKLYMTLFGDEKLLAKPDPPPADLLEMKQRQHITALFQEITTMLAFPDKGRAVDFHMCWERLCSPDESEIDWYNEEMMNCCQSTWILCMWLKGEDIKQLCYGRTIISAAILNGFRARTFQHADRHIADGTLESFNFLRRPADEPFVRSDVSVGVCKYV